MAGIEVVASIIALAGTGIKVSMVLFDLAERIGSAGEEVRLVAVELTLFSNVLEAVRSTIESAPTVCTPAAYQLVDQVVQHCTLVVAEIGDIVSALTREGSGSDFPSLEWTSRVKWTFKKSKVQVKRQTLESCKSTLHLLLMTIRWSRRYSSDQLSSMPQASNSDQYPMLTQGLVLAVRSAVNQLRTLEEADDSEDKNVVDGTDSARFSGLLGGLALSVKKPVPHYSKQRRTSVWLDKLIFDETTDDEIHPGMRQHRLSSAATARDPFVLLDKWTENRPRRAVIQPDPDVYSLLHSSEFDFGAARESGEDLDKMPKLPRVFTKPVSPKSTLTVAKTGAMAATIAFPALETFIDSKWSQATSEQWLMFLIDDLKLQHHQPDFELAIVYGGAERALSPEDKPYAMFEDLTKYNLKPQLILRRHESRTPDDTRLIDGGAVTVSPTTVTFAESGHP